MVGFTSGPDVPKQIDASTISTVPRVTVVGGCVVIEAVGPVVAVLVIPGVSFPWQYLHGMSEGPDGN
jgi:hypothetical protein